MRKASVTFRVTSLLGIQQRRASLQRAPVAGVPYLLALSKSSLNGVLGDLAHCTVVFKQAQCCENVVNAQNLRLSLGKIWPTNLMKTPANSALIILQVTALKDSLSCLAMSDRLRSPPK